VGLSKAKKLRTSGVERREERLRRRCGGIGGTGDADGAFRQHLWIAPLDCVATAMMRRTRQARAARWLSAAATLVLGSAIAEDDVAKQSGPANPKKTIAEKIAPPQKGRPDRPDAGASGAGQGEPLGQKLGRTDGVIRPPETVDPHVQVAPPVPEPGTTRVIPPPGSPGNPSPVRPK